MQGVILHRIFGQVCVFEPKISTQTQMCKTRIGTVIDRLLNTKYKEKDAKFSAVLNGGGNMYFWAVVVCECLCDE